MTAAMITHPAGTATPLLSGGWAVDFGDPFPTIVADRDTARRVLAARPRPATSVRQPFGERTPA